MDHPTSEILTAEVREGLDALIEERGEGFAHCCVTSPPYWSLRDYESGGQEWDDGWDGELGAEPHPAMYVRHIVDVMDRLWPAMRDDGILWLNIGDCYAKDTLPEIEDDPYWDRVKKGDLLNLPLAVGAALRRSGWYLRCALPWVKLQYVPQPVHSRPSLGHEYVLMLTPTMEPYFDSYAVRRRAVSASGPSSRLYRSSDATIDSIRGLVCANDDPAAIVTPSVTKSGGHVAAFSPWLPRDLILAGTSAHGVCSECGAPYKRKLTKRSTAAKVAGRIKSAPGIKRGQTKSSELVNTELNDYAPDGWEPQCGCDVERTPATVIDPFCGSGTVGVVCKELQRSFVGIEIDANVAKAARSRVESGAVSVKSSESLDFGLLE